MPAATPILMFLGLIVMEPDLGTAIACAGIAACILYVAGMRMRYFGYALRRVVAGALYPDLSRGLAARPHSGIFESLCGPRRKRASTSFSL